MPRCDQTVGVWEELSTAKREPKLGQIWLQKTRLEGKALKVPQNLQKSPQTSLFIGMTSRHGGEGGVVWLSVPRKGPKKVSPSLVDTHQDQLS